MPNNLDAKLLALFSKSKRELLILKRLRECPQSSLDLRNFFAERGDEVSQAQLRQHILSIRRKLDNFYSTQNGTRCASRLTLPEGKRDARWTIDEVPNVLPESSLAFWSGHLSNGRRTAVLPYEFIYDRRVDAIEELGLGRNASEATRPAPMRTAMRYDMASRSGNVRTESTVAMLTVHSYLAAHLKSAPGTPSPIIPTYEELSSLASDNLVVLGPAVDNRDFDETLLDPHFCLKVGEGVLMMRTLREGARWREFYRPPEADLPYHFQKHLALVSVQGSRADGRAIMFVKATHPLALQAACNCLTDAGIQLLDRNGSPITVDQFPRTYQAGFEVVFDFGTRGVLKVNLVVLSTPLTDAELALWDEHYTAECLEKWRKHDQLMAESSLRPKLRRLG